MLLSVLNSDYALSQPGVSVHQSPRIMSKDKAILDHKQKSYKNAKVKHINKTKRRLNDDAISEQLTRNTVLCYIFPYLEYPNSFFHKG